jgi:cytosine/adenosine deaminase-related metal-dependent hydrolase
LIRCHAAWVLPISQPPIQDGWVAIDDGRVVACGSAAARPATGAAREIDLGRAVILPGLVNAHTHLELSHLAGRVPPGETFVGWIRGLLAARFAAPLPDTAEILAGVERGIEAALRCGTAAVGDISNTLVTAAPLARSRLDGVVFNEIIGFNPADAAALVEQARDAVRALNAGAPGRASLAAHAPYSVAPAVLRAIAAAVADEGWPGSIHVSESAEEAEFIRAGTGPWRSLLEDLKSWNPSWTPSGVSPVAYLEEQQFLTPQTMAVHGVQMTDADLGQLASRGTTLVTCPRSNGYTGAGTPPVARFYASGVRVAVGTDSLTSTPDLNVFTELAAMRRIAPGVAAAAFLDSATRQGARALALDREYGTIDPGKRARLVHIALPAGVNAARDVEEYLVSGVAPEQIAWIDDRDR